MDATIGLILELGVEPSRDAIAARAGVGIGTLYRHFPDQQTLLYAVVHDVLDRTISQGENAIADSDSGTEALRRYMHTTIDTGLAVVNIIYPLLKNPDWPERATAAQAMLERLITAAQREGAIRNHVTTNDIALAAIRFCRPLAIGLDPETERTIAHQQLDTYLNGLIAGQQ
jgi:AcrR family transcriptional regulator